LGSSNIHDKQNTQFMTQAKQYFDNHTTVEQLYFTSDNLAFFDEQNAINHAGQLDDPTVTAMTRDEVYEGLEEITNADWEAGLEYDPLEGFDGE
jgi:hypothetical protein